MNDDFVCMYVKSLTLLLMVFVLVLYAAIALICPLFVEDDKVFNEEAKLVAAFSEISSSQQLEQLQAVYERADNVIVDLLDWQVCITASVL